MMASVVMVLMSCGDSSVVVEDKNLSYDGIPVVEVVDAQVTMEPVDAKHDGLSFTEDRPVLRVTYKLINNVPDISGVSIEYRGYDEEGSELDNLEWDSSRDDDQAQKLVDLIESGTVGSEVKIKFPARKWGERGQKYPVDKLATLKLQVWPKDDPNAWIKFKE